MQTDTDTQTHAAKTITARSIAGGQVKLGQLQRELSVHVAGDGYSITAADVSTLSRLFLRNESNIIHFIFTPFCELTLSSAIAASLSQKVNCTCSNLPSLNLVYWTF